MEQFKLSLSSVHLFYNNLLEGLKLILHKSTQQKFGVWVIVKSFEMKSMCTTYKNSSYTERKR